MQKKQKIRDIIGIMLGSVLTALALDIFLIPNKIAAGGVSGLATVIYYLTGLPVGITMLVCNIPLFIWALKALGARFGVGSLLGAIVLSVATDVLARFTGPMTADVLLNSLYGGVLSGIGIGIVLKYNGSTAGTVLAAKILNKYTGMSVGQCLLVFDFSVILCAGIVFKSAELSLYAAISVYVSSLIIDLVQQGQSASRAFFVISQHSTVIAEQILADLDRGVTLLHGKGAYTDQEQDVLFVVVETGEISRLKEVIHDSDPHAFVIVADVHEVLGEGFRQYAGH